MNRPLFALLFVVAACGGGTTTTTAPSSRRTLDSIPQAAAAALRRAAGGATIEHVERDGDLYEARWQVGGLEREAAVTESGELVELEEEVESTQVPARVRAGAIMALPNAQSMKFVKLQSGNFEAEAIVDGKEVEVMLAPDGRTLPDADDDD